MKKNAIDLYLEGMGFRTIGRVLKISYGTVYQWVRKAGESVNMTKVEKPVAVVELDNTLTFNKMWDRICEMDVGVFCSDG